VSELEPVFAQQAQVGTAVFASAIGAIYVAELRIRPN
jgi:hypothetical protein